MPLLMRKMALLAKLETTYNVDAVPTGAANAMVVRNVRVNPLTVESEARDIARPYLGNNDTVVGAFYGSLEYDIEAAGSGVAGTAPKWGPLMQACGFAQVVTAGVSVTYTPVSSAFSSLSKYFYLDGVLHKFTGSRGSVAFKGNNRSPTMWGYRFLGLFQPVVDAVLPTADYTGFVKPLAFNTANTPTFTIHGVAGVLRNLSIDMANQVSYRNLVNSEAVQLLDRKPVGSLEMEATLMATKNWFNTARDGSTGALQLIHGTTPGNIIEINAPGVQVTDPQYSEFENAAMLQAGMVLRPNIGNDEISIVVR
jgi:hypothetical protein